MSRSNNIVTLLNKVADIEDVVASQTILSAGVWNIQLKSL